MYSKEVMDHFQSPRNLGAIDSPDAVGNVGNPVCGDMMKIYLKIALNEEGKEVIEKIGFETLGCVAAIATSSMVTELAEGKTLDEAMKIEFKDVEKALGSLPPIKVHCADLSVRALRKAIEDYRAKRG
ncbi:MAG: iron-sulfur cluster assembly scaffold protein [Candidatus Colwellbacteria bacterium]|nr:iron-sulfur cluster assembly scaffold protein [Candidatus Colwellbacteria bacterium]